MLLGVPLLVAAVLLGVLGLRVAVAHIDVAAAASAAARDASLQRTPGAAQAAATNTATVALQDKQLTCNPMQVTPDVSGYAPGGTVTVDITCTIDVSDLVGLAIPTQITVSGTSTQPVDTFRAIPGAGGPP
jgi:hypothetical protein